MLPRRRRHLQRNVLVFLGSLAGHLVVFLIAANEFRFYPPPPEQQPAVQVEIVPETMPPITPPPPPPPVPIVQPKAQLQPPKPAPQAVQQAAPKPTPTPTAPIRATPNPTPAPAPNPSLAPSPLAPPIPAPEAGPPKAVPSSSIIKSAPLTTPAHTLVLHKSQQPASALAPSVSIPGAVFAQPQAPGGAPAGGGGPAGAGAHAGAGLPGGKLPGFGPGLRGGALGCMNAGALHLTLAERQRCEMAYGEGTKDAPQMDRIDASRRAVLDQEATQEAAAAKYRDSTPAGTASVPIPGQPRLGHAPGE